jgi:hypothetical protein
MSFTLIKDSNIVMRVALVGPLMFNVTILSEPTRVRVVDLLGMSVQ